MSNLSNSIPKLNLTESAMFWVIVTVSICAVCLFIKILREINENVRYACAPLVCIFRCCCGSSRAVDQEQV